MQPPTKVPMVDAVHGSHIVPISEEGDRRRATVDQIKAYVGADAGATAAAALQAVSAEARSRSDADQSLADGIGAEARARGSADTAEASARIAGDRVNADAIAAEAQARVSGDKINGDALTAEAKARSEADAAQAARQVKLSGTLSLPAGLAIVAGKTVRTAMVSGLKAGDDIAVTPKAALPAGVAMAEVYCLTDGVLSVALTAAALVTLSAKVDVPLGIVVLR